jgi:toxin YoeB
VNVAFVEDGWEQFRSWLAEDKKTIKKINNLIDSISREGERKGIGHPEPLQGNLSGWWSRHIDEKNRLIYRVTENRIEIRSCSGHYNDK